MGFLTKINSKLLQSTLKENKHCEVLVKSSKKQCQCVMPMCNAYVQCLCAMPMCNAYVQYCYQLSSAVISCHQLS